MIRRVLLPLLCLFAASPAFAEGFQRGVALGETIHVYAAPDAKSPTLGTLDDGDAVLVLERSSTATWLDAEKDYWYRCESDGARVGWVHGSQILRSELEGQITASGVRVRQSPSPQGAFVRSLGAGTWVTVLDRTPEPETIGDATARWYQVRTGTATGWVFGRYLRLALTAPSAAHAPFLGWRCWPGRVGQLHPTDAQILSGLTQWRRIVEVDIARRLTPTDSAAVDDAMRRLAAGWGALRAEASADAMQAVEPLTQLTEDVATPLGSAQATGALFYAYAAAQGSEDESEITAALDRAMSLGRGKILTGTDWSTPADLAAFDRYLFLLEQEWKDALRARRWVETVATDTTQSSIVRAAAGAASVRLHFAARREPGAITAARRVFVLGGDAQVSCGPLPVHYGATALTVVCDELTVIGGAADAATMCEALARSGDPTLQAVARARLAQLHDAGVADLETVVAAYDAVPEFRIRLADLRTLDAGDSAARGATLRALTERVGAVDEAWVTGDRVRLRSAPSRRGAVLDALRRDTVVRMLYRPPAWAVADDLPWIKVRVRGGQIGWMTDQYLELRVPRAALLPETRGLLWSQAGGAPDGRSIAPGAEIDEPVVLWRVPDILSGGPALGDASGDGIADLVVTGVSGTSTCPRGVAALDGWTQGELWRAETAGCVGDSSVAVGGARVYVVSDGRTLEAFNLRTGEPAWSWQPDEAADLTAPAATSNVVAVGASDGSVTVLDAATGRQVMRAVLGAPVIAPPAIADGVVYAVTEEHVNAVDFHARRPLWRARLARHQRRRPGRGRTGGGIAVMDDLVLAVSPGGMLAVCDRARGNVRWQVDVGGTPAGGPIGDGARVIVALASGDLRAWTVGDGSPDWRSRAPGPITSRILLADHTLVFGTADGVVTGLSRVDGRMRWMLDLGAPLDRGPAGGGRRVVIGSSGGPLFVIGDAADAAGVAPAALRTGADR